MKLFREAIIILGIYLLGEFISEVLSLPVPGNILGMIILLFLLCTKIIKLEQINTISNFLLDHLAFFFIPAGVGLMTSVDIIKDSWLKLIVVCIATTIIIISSTGLIVQYITRKNNKRGENLEHINK
ncbi:CidA/LrgA family protein [Clostridium vincentii]|uniref:Antiholin-like protein LrgA n=1 Tax=Clostridium vincentii TaxID=52704 RepID=A0A2T0BHS5_9CLOT|nr:CidA/LrgA family protein [Clostridium vincentii]PRR83440.1 Antiholin-like protein LrgA [Clostridium vincentii]